MSFKIKRLSSQLLLANLLFLLTMALVVNLIIYFGFRQAQDNATSISVEALTDQGRDALRQMTEQEAAFADRQLARTAALGQVAVNYLLAMQDSDGRAPWDMNRLTTAPGGQRYDADPDRKTEVWIGPDTTIDDQMQRDLQETAVFDALFPALMEESPDGVAIYYMGVTGLGRYYPVNNLIEQLPPDFSIADQPFYALVGPTANPVRTVVWSPPYEDFAGLGPIVTASTPIYQDGDFRGVIGVDISLVQLIERLNNLLPTTSGYAFLVDDGSRLVAAPPNALNALLEPGQVATRTETLGIPLNQSVNPQVLAALDQIQQEKSGVVELELSDQPVLLAHAPLPTVGWQLGLVAPVAEIASQSQAVATTIQQDASNTLQSTTLVLTALFLIALLLVGMVNRRMIVQRIEALADGVQSIANGDLDVRLAPLGEDEIGLLGQSINEMAEQLTAARDELEDRVARRTRELAALFDVTAVAENTVPAIEQTDQTPYWAVLPEHVEVAFSDYAQPDSIQMPKIYVYPVSDLTEMNQMAADQVNNLQELLVKKPDLATINPLPFMPLFNAQAMFYAQGQYLDFGSGSGIRYLTQYGQAATPVTNQELFYTFQGLTDDGAYYVAAVFPVAQSDLPADMASADTSFSANFEAYIQGVQDALTTAASSSFTPNLDDLDNMVSTITIQ